MAKKLVIFDFDGVLVDTLFVGHSVTKEVNENISVDEYKSFFEGNINDSIGKKINPHPDFFGRYDDYAREIKVPDILKEIIKELAQKYTLVIVSSTGTSSIKKILERENVLQKFETILGNDVETSKVKKIKMILDKYNALPKDAVFITDTLGDILEGEKCGVKAIAVTWGFHDRKTLEKGNPVAIIDDPRDLVGTIENVLVP